MDEKKLKELIDSGFTTRQIAGCLKKSQTSIVYWIKKLKIIIKHKSKGGKRAVFIVRKCLNCGKDISGNRHQKRNNKYCNSKCRRDLAYKEYIARWLSGKETGNIIKGTCLSAHVRRWALEKSGEKCEKCGWDKKNPVTNRCPLTVHHKNGDSMNSSADNIETICPNCHSLTETYGGLNKGRGRKYRYKSGNNSTG